MLFYFHAVDYGRFPLMSYLGAPYLCIPFVLLSATHFLWVSKMVSTSKVSVLMSRSTRFFSRCLLALLVQLTFVFLNLVILFLTELS